MTPGNWDLPQGRMSEVINEETYRRLKRDVENAKTEADRAKGALTTITAQLEEEFGVDNLKEAKEALAELEAKRDKAKEKFDTALKDYQKKWSPE